MALTDDILAYWNLNDNGSSGVSLVDDTGNGNTLTNNNGVTLGTGIIAGDAVFNPSLSNSLTTPITIGSDFSISAWVNITAFDGGVSVTGSSNDANAPSIVAASNVTYFFYGNNGGDCNSSINAPPLTIGTWHNIVGTISSSTSICRWYLDSVLISQDTFTGLGNFTEIQIGAYLARSIGTFNGQVDEVGVWNRALSPNEVYNLYYNGTGNTYPFTKPVIERPLTDDILAYWNLNNDGSGGVSLVDDTGNGYILTNNNGVTLGTGIIAGDAVFNGTQSLSNASFQAPSIGNFSVSLWANTTVFNNYSTLFTTRSISSFSAPSAYSITISPYGFVVIYSGGFIIDDGIVPIPSGTWTNIIVTRELGVCTIYLNGTSAATAAWTNDLTEPTLSLGSIYGILSEPLDGQVDEVGVWNRALSPEDVTKLYNGGSGNTYPFGQTPFSPLFYNNAENDGDWGNILNWWLDSGFTNQATALPTSTNPINLYNEVTQNTQGANQCFCSSANFWSANFGVGLTLQASGVVNMQGTSLLAGTTTDGVSMHDSSQLTATSVVEGNVTMRDSSRAFGSILGNATIYYDGGNGQFPIGGTVAGSVTYIGWPALSPQWFNDTVSGGANDGDFANMANWWSDNTYTTRPINSVGYQELPDASTDVFIAPDTGIYANTGGAILVNSITANKGYISSITLTVSNGIVFSGNGNYGTANSIIYANVTFSGTAYNNGSAIIGNADYKSSISLVESFNHNSLGNITLGALDGSSSMTVSIAGGGGTSLGTNWISRLLHLPWFINV